MKEAYELFERRKRRTRFKLGQVAAGRPRLSVFRSKKHTYAQIINDGASHTIAAASTLDKDMKKKIKSTSNLAAAEGIGKLIAERALKAGVTEVVFDRGGYLYHGRV
jgi:large subunit ribosomal protein L18